LPALAFVAICAAIVVPLVRRTRQRGLPWWGCRGPTSSTPSGSRRRYCAVPRIGTTTSPLMRS